jgi:hypothetical protein
LTKIVEQYHVVTVAICLEDRRSVLPVQALLDLKARGVDITDGHRLFEEASGRLAVDTLRPSQLIFSTGFHVGWITRVAKRALDVLLSELGLVIFLPFFALIPIWPVDGALCRHSGDLHISQCNSYGWVNWPNPRLHAGMVAAGPFMSYAPRAPDMILSEDHPAPLLIRWASYSLLRYRHSVSPGLPGERRMLPPKKIL